MQPSLTWISGKYNLRNRVDVTINVKREYIKITRYGIILKELYNEDAYIIIQSIYNDWLNNSSIEDAVQSYISTIDIRIEKF